MSFKFSPEIYPIAELAKALENDFLDTAALRNRNHLDFFSEYFSNTGLSARCIVEEEQYISKAYISDYSSYYSTSFFPFERFCRRLHFFDCEFDTREELLHYVLDADSTYLQDHYLGFIVVRPLPNNLIGTTILKTYDKEKEEGSNTFRYYNTVRDYDVNFFGRRLTVSSLAFQEQDAVVAACASTALWCAFNHLSKLFQIPQVTPYEITKAAGSHPFNAGRQFPNRGLNVQQVCKAIEASGLVTELRAKSEQVKGQDLGDRKYFKRIVYAYSRAGIPVLLGININGIGEHLVCLTGYEKQRQTIERREEMSLTADLIDKLYVHDDQVGPFSRLHIRPEGSTVGAVIKDPITGFEIPLHKEAEILETSWPDGRGTEKRKADLISIIIPVYNKIRIRYEDVMKRVAEIDTLLYKGEVPLNEVTWDVFLTSGNDYKRCLLKRNKKEDGRFFINDRLREKVAAARYPRYIWVARASTPHERSFDILFDSTDIANGFFCLDINCYTDYWKQLWPRLLLERTDGFAAKIGVGKKAMEKIMAYLTAA